MNNEPRPEPAEPSRLPELDDPFLAELIADIEKLLNTDGVPDDKIDAYLARTTQQLDKLIGDRYRAALCDVVGVGRKSDRLDRVDHGEDELYVLKDVSYMGVSIIRVDSTVGYRVLLTFMELNIEDEVFYNIAPDPQHLWQISVDTDSLDAYDNEQIVRDLQHHADGCEVTINSEEFIMGSREDQVRLLQQMATTLSDYAIKQFGNDIISVISDEITILTTKDDRSGFEVREIVNKPSATNRPYSPVGTVKGATFFELMQTADQDSITAPIRKYPSLVVRDESDGTLYLIPIKMLKTVFRVQGKNAA